MTETASPNDPAHTSSKESGYSVVSAALLTPSTETTNGILTPYFASSIGPTERAILPTGNYIDHDCVTKNFCTEVKTRLDEVQEVFKQIDGYELAEGARLNISFIAKLDVLAQALESEDHWRWYVEGVTPLTGCGISEVEDMCIINLGRNDPNRPMDYQAFYALLDTAQQIYDGLESPRPVSACPEGYEYQPFDGNNTQLRRAVIEMLIGFEWDRHEAEAIVESKDVQFGLMTHTETGDLASLIGLETRSLNLEVEGKDISFDFQVVAEAITDQRHKGKGLYGYVNSEIMRRNVEAGKIPNVQVGETNLLPGLSVVINAFGNQGRGCGLMQPSIRNRLGLELNAERAETTLGTSDGSSGTATKQARPNSFLVTYLTKEMIEERYKKHTYT